MTINAFHLAEKLSLFSDLSTIERDELVRASRVRTLKKGDHVFYHGDASASFFIVVSGAIRTHRETPDGKEVTLHIAIVGDTLGDHEMFENKPSYQTSAIAAEDSLVLEYPVRWIREKIREHSALALNMLAAVSKSSSRMTIDREHMVTLKTPQRIGCFLMRLCDIHQLDPKKFTLPYSKATIASKLGMEPESFSRALAKLKEIGVMVNGNEVSIHSVSALNDYVCSACSVSEDCETCDHLHNPQLLMQAAEI
jgi:CRP-like cAMP-binding protein